MNKSSVVKDITFIAITAAFICICSLLTIPGPVPFTLQTFAVFFALRFLGGRNGLISIVLYILLGTVGLPVFSSFGSGLGVLLGPTGGYIFGFILMGVIYWIFARFCKKELFKIFLLIGGLLVCYLFGTLWFMKVMYDKGSSYSFLQALLTCVVPFIVPDLIKLFAASYISDKITKALKKRD